MGGGVRAVKSEPFANDLTRVADDDLDIRDALQQRARKDVVASVRPQLDGDKPIVWRRRRLRAHPLARSGAQLNDQPPLLSILPAGLRVYQSSVRVHATREIRLDVLTSGAKLFGRRAKAKRIPQIRCKPRAPWAFTFEP